MDQATHTPPKPGLGEDAFQQLLSAAFVLQEHNQRLRTGDEPKEGYAKILSEISETQDLIQERRLDTVSATSLIAERLRKITDATGAAIAILQRGELNYTAGSGTAAGDVGEHARVDMSLGAECVRTGHSLQSADAEKDARLRQEVCRKKKVRSLLVVPIHYEHRVAGVIELRFDRTNAFGEQDLHTCQLMAAVVADVIARENQREYQQSVAKERAAMLQALDTIKPQLDRLTGEEEPDTGASHIGAAATSKLTGVEICRCGHRFTQAEAFCGICGRERSSRKPATAAQTSAEPAPARGTNLQQTWASLWQMHEQENGQGGPAQREVQSNSSRQPVPADLEEVFAQLSDEESGDEPDAPMPSRIQSESSILPSGERSAEPVLGREQVSGFELHAMQENPAPVHDAPVNGNRSTGAADFHDNRDHEDDPQAAAEYEAEYEPEEFAEDNDPRHEEVEPARAEPTTALQLRPLRIVEADARNRSNARQSEGVRNWLDAQHPWRIWLSRQWRAYRANVYLAASAALLLVVIFGWSGHPLPAAAPGSAKPTQRHKAPPAPQLSLFDQALVSLGLAEAPPTPAYMGDPNVKVWEDTHTALYYCPGSDLYGKTRDGRYATQRDAQIDKFEPNSRRVCD